MKVASYRTWTAVLAAAMLVPASAVLHAASVREFGAIGDGVADDTAAIQRAVEAGGEVTFSRGTFRVTRPVTLQLERIGYVALSGDGTASVRMEGPGPAFHFVGAVQRSANPADFPEKFWDTQRMPSVDRLAITGAHAEADGIRVTRAMQFTVARCHLRRLRHAIHLTERNRNVLIGDCHIYDNRGVGIYLAGVDLHQINIGNCHISYNRGGGVVARGGAVRNLQISGCDIEANMHPESPPTANVLLDSTGGSTAEVEITGCTIQHSYRSNPGSANIRVIGRGERVGTSTENRWGQLVISGNLINDADTNIHLDGVRVALLSGNTLHLGARHDILIENSSQIALSGNIHDRHARHTDNREVAQNIVFRDSNDCTLTGLHVRGAAETGIVIERGRRFHISSCTVLDSPGGGIRLEGVEDSFVHGNLLQSGAPAEAIRVVGGKNNIVEGNRALGDQVSAER